MFSCGQFLLKDIINIGNCKNFFILAMVIKRKMFQAIRMIWLGISSKFRHEQGVNGVDP